MNSRSRKNPVLVLTLIACLTLIGGSGMAQSEQTTVGTGPGMGMSGGMGQPQGADCTMHGGMHGKGKHRQGMKGGGHAKHGKHHGQQGRTRFGQHLFGGHWSQSLSNQQKAQLDQLHINHTRIKAPLKARIKALKVDLAVLATAPEPDKTVIDAKIEEMLKLKGQLLGAEYGYIAAQRQVLTPMQQVSFDMEKIHGAMHGKGGKGGKDAKH